MPNRRTPRALVAGLGEDADALNVPVYLALGLGRADAETRQALIALLRSNEPIQPAIRDILADALEGSDPDLAMTLKRKKRGPRPDIEHNLQTAMRRLKIGRWIAEHPDAGVSMESVIAAATAKFGGTRAKAFKALAYYRAAVSELQAQDR